jgi:hypothetical protein
MERHTVCQYERSQGSEAFMEQKIRLFDFTTETVHRRFRGT